MNMAWWVPTVPSGPGPLPKVSVWLSPDPMQRLVWGPLEKNSEVLVPDWVSGDLVSNSFQSPACSGPHP